jgi:hypothetical protein
MAYIIAMNVVRDDSPLLTLSGHSKIVAQCLLSG